MLVILTENSLQLLAMETQPQAVIAASNVIQSGEDGEATTDNELLPSNQSKAEIEGEEKNPSSTDFQATEEGTMRRESVVTTIQEKYRLPQTSWQADSSSMASLKENSRLPIAESSADNASPLVKQVRFDRKSKLPCAQYDQVLDAHPERKPGPPIWVCKEANHIDLLLNILFLLAARATGGQARRVPGQHLEDAPKLLPAFHTGRPASHERHLGAARARGSTEALTPIRQATSQISRQHDGIVMMSMDSQ